jgi:hypothetical protein
MVIYHRIERGAVFITRRYPDAGKSFRVNTYDLLILKALSWP